MRNIPLLNEAELLGAFGRKALEMRLCQRSCDNTYEDVCFTLLRFSQISPMAESMLEVFL